MHPDSLESDWLKLYCIWRPLFLVKGDRGGLNGMELVTVVHLLTGHVLSMGSLLLFLHLRRQVSPFILS